MSCEGVLAAAVGDAALGHHQQVEIVVAEDGQGRRAERAEEAQRFERVRAAIDQVADHPQPVTRRVEVTQGEQALQRVVAALDVADGVGGHYSTVTDLARFRGLSTSVPLTSAAW